MAPERERLFPDWTDAELVRRLAYTLEMAVEFGRRAAGRAYDDLWFACVERGLLDQWHEAKAQAKRTVAELRRR